MESIFDLTFPDLTLLMTNWGETPYRARQVWHGLYRKLWSLPDQFTDIPITLRKRLSDEFSFSPLVPKKQLTSSDNSTSKLLLDLEDRNAIEAVLMRYEKRNTVCISTQVGCAMGCSFCATGQMGFKRHLRNGEIVAQVLFFARLLLAQEEELTNIVIMGMGEPFHNYENTMAAIDQINNHDGFNFGARRITVSTVGLIPAIERFISEKRQVNLAISLHAADNDLRASMLPIAKVYQLHDLFEVCRKYTLMVRRRLSFEWALVRGINDTLVQAELLAKQLKGILCHVNLIPLNPTSSFGGVPSSQKSAIHFKDILTSHGINCTIRQERGIDIQAGCGQLYVENLEI